MTIFSAPNYCGEFDNAGAMMVRSLFVWLTVGISCEFCSQLDSRTPPYTSFARCSLDKRASTRR